jgi:DNA-binding NarL/FixJ family response regulator
MMPRGAVTLRQIEQLTEPLAAIDLAGYLRFLRRLMEGAIAPIRLTRTEIEILRELRTGKSTAEIAADLGKATKTVSWHLGELYKKLGCNSRIAAIDVAESQGLL